jgi:hypothetical protein
MPLLGFTPTKKMLEEAKKHQVVHTGVVIDVIHDGPVMETMTVPSVEIPTYTEPKVMPVVKPLLESSKSTKLPAMPTKRNPDPKRKVNLNPLSN